MSKPATLIKGKEKVRLAIRHQFWLFFVSIISIALLDTLYFLSDLVITRSFVAGAALVFFNQCLFSYLVFRHVGYQSRQKVVNSLYLAEICKWLFTIIGFIIIFKTLDPINLVSVILGYIFLKVSYLIHMFNIK